MYVWNYINNLLYFFKFFFKYRNRKEKFASNVGLRGIL